MPNSRDPNHYPVLLFDALHKAADEGQATLECPSPQAARNLRSQLYTFRQALLASPEQWHRELAQSVQSKKFYITASSIVISDPLLFTTSNVTLSGAPQ